MSPEVNSPDDSKAFPREVWLFRTSRPYLFRLRSLLPRHRMAWYAATAKANAVTPIKERNNQISNSQ